jgi:hypothetical protein
VLLSALGNPNRQNQTRYDLLVVYKTDICFQQPVTKGDATADLHEKRIRAFVDDVQKNKLKLADSGTIVVTKVEHKKYWLVTTTEELERWHLRYQLDVIDPDELSKQLTTMMEELNKEALADGQSGANEDNVEFDIQFAS